jgi:hypothetical protein
MSGLAELAAPERGLDPVHSGWPHPEPPYVVVVDPWLHGLRGARTLLERAQAVYVLAGRPTVEAADAIDEIAANAGVARVVSGGAGLVTDAVKLTVYRRRERTGELLVHAAVPCGPEPYRAVAPFSMYEGKPGVRDGVWGDWLRPPEVALAPELLAALDEETVALFCGDSLVHAIESVLTRLSSPASERYALAALDAFVAAAGDGPGPSRTDLALASIAAARAFDYTKLGLAHALSRPLGIAAGISHDGFNLMLGAPVVGYLGDEVVARSPLARVRGVEPTAAAWYELVDGYRARAGLPRFLPDTGLGWDAVEAAIAWAPNSSGIPNLPEPLAPGDLVRIMTDAWGPSLAGRRE